MEPLAYIGATVIAYHMGMPVPVIVNQVHGGDSISGTALPFQAMPFAVYCLSKCTPAETWGWHWPVMA